jgi:purine-binding chemotaxis protein CheW
VENQLVVFSLANEHYGVKISAVESIIKLQSIKSVPRAPAFVEGVTNLRGVVLPVIDLRKRFDLPAQEATQDSRIVVVEVNGDMMGVVVDAVSEVLRVSEEDVEPPPPLVLTADSAFITGIAKVDERLIMLLNLGQVLNAQERDELQTFQLGRKALVDKVMKHKNIPPGQLCVYKALLEADSMELSFKELSDVTERSQKDMRSTLGAIGKRVTEAIGKTEGKPSRLLIEKSGARYHLTPELLAFIKATPELESALRESSMSKFFLHSEQAWQFVWNERKTGGRLESFFLL